MYGAEKFKELFEKYKSRPLLLYGDPDCDGLISLLLMCQFCDMFGLKYSYYVNEHRYHGFTLDIRNLSGYLIIAADFSITEVEMQQLVDNDVAILSTDHHEIQKDFINVSGKAEGVVINNQYEFEPREDRYLSGAGVFYELICSLYPEFKSKLREALVGITLLSDIRATESEKARAYLKSTFTIDAEQYPYIKYLISNVLQDSADYSFGVPRMDRNFIDFNLSPTINALLRFNKTAEATDFILGRGLARSGSQSYRGRQRDLMRAMSERAMLLDMPNVSILCVNDVDFRDFIDIELSDFIGLFCSEYKDKHGGKSTLGFTLSNGVVTRASFRGKYDDIHYLTGFKNNGIDANGHPNAFGIKNFSPTQETWVMIHDLVTDLESTHQSTITVVSSGNLALTLLQTGQKYANENCYVRDWYRTYYKYTGNNAKIVNETYRMEEFTKEDYVEGRKPDKEKSGIFYKYILDTDGNKIPKYIEYLIDGRKVKSFGVHVEDGLILPILERGYLQLYVKPMLA